MKATSGLLLLVILLAIGISGQARAGSVAPCPRPGPGETIRQPPDLYSRNGVLKVHLTYYTAVDDEGRTLFCFMTDDGRQSPTLHVNPGDRIKMSVTNAVPDMPGSPVERVASGQNVCGNPVMTLSSVNVHFHGTNTAPRCHSDEVIFTLINSGETFDYDIRIPEDEPPGMYWYHPHVHGTSSDAVTGGASGAIIVEGIENIQPAVVGLPQRILLLRDMPLAFDSPVITSHPPGPAPFWDLSLNYVPVAYPAYRPAVIRMQAGRQEFWRVVNASANSIFDIKLLFDGIAQPLEIAALDGVPTGSQNGKHQGTIITQKDILIPPAGRAEFIVTAPDKTVRSARLITEAVDTGQIGDSMPRRPIADIRTTREAPGLPLALASGLPHPARFGGLENIKPSITRHLYFSETFGHAPGGERVNFFITVRGQDPKLFDPNDPPAIVTTRGSVEDWIIQNRSPEVHEFHIHQIHFLLLEIDGVPVPPEQRQFYDTFQVPYWDQIGKYPSIKVRMDFRGPVVGDFVYHCHILQHEDGGMMAKIRVLPRK